MNAAARPGGKALNAEGELTELTITEYDLNGRMTRATTSSADGTTIASEELTYGPFGRVARSVDHNGRITTRTYNSDGTVASTSLSVADKVLTSRFSYDAMGRRILVERPDGKQVRTQLLAYRRNQAH